ALGAPVSGPSSDGRRLLEERSRALREAEAHPDERDVPGVRAAPVEVVDLIADAKALMEEVERGLEAPELDRNEAEIHGARRDAAPVARASEMLERAREALLCDIELAAIESDEPHVRLDRAGAMAVAELSTQSKRRLEGLDRPVEIAAEVGAERCDLERLRLDGAIPMRARDREGSIDRSRRVVELGEPRAEHRDANEEASVVDLARSGDRRRLLRFRERGAFVATRIERQRFAYEKLAERPAIVASEGKSPELRDVGVRFRMSAESPPRLLALEESVARLLEAFAERKELRPSLGGLA